MEKARKDWAQDKREDRSTESAPAIDWTKDVYCKLKDGVDVCYHISPDETIKSRIIGSKIDKWTNTMICKWDIQNGLGRGIYVVIPNPWPKEDVEEKYRGVFVNKDGDTWWRLGVEDYEFCGRDGEWKILGPWHKNEAMGWVDSGIITLDPSPPWMKKEEKTVAEYNEKRLHGSRG